MRVTVYLIHLASSMEPDKNWISVSMNSLCDGGRIPMRITGSAPK